jgi:hypothetical protein
VKTILGLGVVAQGEKPDSSQVMLTGRDLDDQERFQVQNHPHTNDTDTLVSNDLLLTAVIAIQIHSGNET